MINHNGQADTLADQRCMSLTSLSALSHLELDGNATSADDVLYLMEMPALVNLNLGAAYMCGYGAELLAGMTWLQSLSLDECFGVRNAERRLLRPLFQWACHPYLIELVLHIVCD